MASVWIVPRDGARGRKYLVYYTDPATGKNKYHKAFPRKKDAQDEEHRLRAYIDTGRNDGLRPARERTRPMSVREVAGLLIPDWEARMVKGKMSKATLDGYKVFLESVLQVYGDRLVMDMRKDEVDAYHAGMTEKKSPASANRRLFVLKQICKKAVALKALSEDPLKGIGFADEEKHQRNRHLDPEEADRLVRAAKAPGFRKYMLPMVLLSLDFGASRQELLDMVWGSLDLVAGTITFKRTKNKVNRTMTLTARCREALLAWRKRQELNRRRMGIGRPSSDLVFCHADGGRLAGFRSSWRRLTKAAGISDYHFHDNRHTFCSGIVNVGGTLKDVMAMIGHKDLRSANRYSHVDKARVADMQRKISERYARVAGDDG